MTRDRGGVRTWSGFAIVAAAALALAGCKDEPADADGDGWAEDEDCDDADPEVYPGAPESCDGKDNDCDDEVDEDAADAATWYLDQDGDGYGDAGVTLAACEAPAGHVDDATDCDDADGDVNPGEAEATCNGLDDDCDATTLDEPDADGDGYSLCDDCDDDEASINPGETEVECDGLDNDCDDTTLDGPDEDADGYTVCEAAGGGDCDDADPDVNPGQAETTCNGVDDDCDPATEDAPDGDGDGHTLCDDCDDANPDVNPGQAETTCNGVDDDCDATTEDAPDADGDSHTVCIDCDDNDAGVHPGVPYDGCDGVDSDCNGAVDDADDDGDGFTACDDCDDTDAGVNPDVAYDGCDGTDSDCNGTVDDGDDDGDGVDACLDCDDQEPAAYPGADEVCDGIDNDCDGGVDEDDAVDAPLWYLDADGDGFGDPDLPLTACAQPPGRVDQAGDCDDGDASIYLGADELCGTGVDENCNGHVDEWCTSVDHCGTIDASESWGAMEVHHVTCTVNVQGAAAPVLTIEDWARVEFEPGAGLVVGESQPGTLMVDGTTGWVTMTSAAANPQPGWWLGLRLGDHADGSVIRGATLEYGGGNGWGGLWVTGTDATFDHLTVRESSNYGLIAQLGGEVTIQDSTFADNGRAGVWIEAETAIADGPDDTFVGNAFEGNAGYGMAVGADNVDQIDASCTFAGNDTDAVWVLSDTIERDASWQALAVPYHVEGYPRVAGANAPTLTIEDGAVLGFEPGVSFEIGENGPGRLVVDGWDQGVVFTSTVAAPTPGIWQGLRFGAQDTGSELLGLTVEYAGGNAWANVLVVGSAVLLDSCTISDSSTHGAFALSGAELEVVDSAFLDNARDGLYVDDSSSLVGQGAATFVGNTLAGNADYPITVPASYAGSMDPSSSFTGNGEDAVRLLSDHIELDSSWQPLDVPYRASEDVYIGGPATPWVTLEDGVVVEFDPGAGLEVGGAAPGGLEVDGAVTGVVFTSSSTTPTPGAWDGVRIDTHDAGSTLLGLTVEYGGGNDWGNLFVVGVPLTMHDCASNASARYGVFAGLGTTLAVSDSSFDDNVYGGIYVDDLSGLSRDGSPSFVGNSFSGNQGYPISLPAEFAGELDASGMYAGGNDEDAVWLLGDDVESDALWQALDAPYRAEGDIRIRGAGAPVVQIADGVTVEFDPGAGLEVGDGGDGMLIADGSVLGITLTTSSAAPAAGSWDGLRLGANNLDSEFTGVTVEYGGGNGWANIYWINSDGAMTDCAIENSAVWGIYRLNANPVLTNVTYAGNASGDLY